MSIHNAARLKFLPTLRRFPLTLLCCLSFCFIAIYGLHHQGLIGLEFYLGTCFVGSVWFSACQLFLESRPSWSRALGYGIALLIFGLVIIYFQALALATIWNFSLLAVAALALLPVAPFTKSTACADRVFIFTYELARQILYAGIASAIVLIGLELIVLSLSLLFKLIYPVIYTDIGVATASLLFSVLTLTGIPKDFDAQEYETGVAFIHSLIGYLVIPLLLFYCAILHWYFVVLCFTQSLPQGVIVYMVSGFGGVGALVFLALYHSKTNQMASIVFFQKHFFKLLLAPLILMAIAIFMRIHQHGLSQARFVVVMVLIWLTLLSALSFTKHMKDFSRFAYLSAACLAMLTAMC